MPVVTVDCEKNGYLRELWAKEQLAFMHTFFGISVVYDWNFSKITWFFSEKNKEQAKYMSTIWELKKQNYRTSYQPKFRTFFWIDTDFYKENKKQILQWAERYNCNVHNKQYGWIEMPNRRVELLFRLQWAGKSWG